MDQRVGRIVPGHPDSGQAEQPVARIELVGNPRALEQTLAPAGQKAPSGVRLLPRLLLVDLEAALPEEPECQGGECLVVTGNAALSLVREEGLATLL